MASASAAAARGPRPPTPAGGGRSRYTAAMSTAPRYEPRYPVDDHRHWEGRWELWNGFPVSMTPGPFGRHAKAITDAATAFKLAVDAARAHDAGSVELLEVSGGGGSPTRKPHAAEATFELNICDRSRLTVPLNALT